MLHAIIVLSNMIIGTSIGLSGLGGFFLPMIYSALLGIDVRDALMLSFITLTLSGLLGTFRYIKFGYIRFPFTIYLAISSLMGAIIGVQINLSLPVEYVQWFLYSFVFLAGLSLLIKVEERDTRNPLLDNLVFVMVLGLLTGIVCAITGAGGSLVLVPVLITMGEKTKYAVGAGIFSAIFISLVASIGYFSHSNLQSSLTIIAVALVSHSIGVLIGTKYVQKINQSQLRKAIAFFSVLSSIVLILRSLTQA